jgi:MerR family mercuric resistance operon transcriptional regulator
MKKKLTIGGLARAAGVGVETVRYYQRRELLDTPAGARTYRQYNGEHLERLQFIKRAQSVGFTLGEIAELLSLNDCRDHRVARKLAQEKIRDLETRIAQMHAMAKSLRHLVHRCEGGKGNMPCPIIRMALD